MTEQRLSNINLNRASMVRQFLHERKEITAVIRTLEPWEKRP